MSMSDVACQYIEHYYDRKRAKEWLDSQQAQYSEAEGPARFRGPKGSELGSLTYSYPDESHHDDDDELGSYASVDAPMQELQHIADQPFKWDPARTCRFTLSFGLVIDIMCITWYWRVLPVLAPGDRRTFSVMCKTLAYEQFLFSPLCFCAIPIATSAALQPGSDCKYVMQKMEDDFCAHWLGRFVVFTPLSIPLFMYVPPKWQNPPFLFIAAFYGLWSSYIIERNRPIGAVLQPQEEEDRAAARIRLRLAASPVPGMLSGERGSAEDDLRQRSRAGGTPDPDPRSPQSLRRSRASRQTGSLLSTMSPGRRGSDDDGSPQRRTRSSGTRSTPMD